MKEKFAIVSYGYCTENTIFNFKGKCSDQFIIEIFDTEQEARQAIETMGTARTETFCSLLEIRKVFITPQDKKTSR